MTHSFKPLSLSVVLATYNERANIGPMLQQLKALLGQRHRLELIVVDDDSPDGSSELVRQLGREDPRIHLIRRVGRSGLSSAIREGLLAACGEVAVVMDADGQHEPEAVARAVERLLEGELDLVLGSRFHPDASIAELSAARQRGSERANQLARFSLPDYAQLTDYMSGFFALRPDRCGEAIRGVDVSGFKFLYELLAVSKGNLKVEEIPLNFRSRQAGDSKLDNAVVWDWLVSLVHTASFRVLPRRAVSFGLVGLSGMVVHVGLFALLRSLGLDFFATQVVAEITAACSQLPDQQRPDLPQPPPPGPLPGHRPDQVPCGVLPRHGRQCGRLHRGVRQPAGGPDRCAGGGQRHPGGFHLEVRRLLPLRVERALLRLQPLPHWRPSRCSSC